MVEHEGGENGSCGEVEMGVLGGYVNRFSGEGR